MVKAKKNTTKKDKLTPMQEGFAWDIANKTYKFAWEAYAANYKADKMSQNAIYVEACRLQSNPKISLRIEKIEKEIHDKEKVTLDEIIIKLSKRVNLDVRDMFNEDSSFKSIKELTQDQAMFLNSFESHEIWSKANGENTAIGELKKVKLESIKDMLDMLIRHYGGYAKDKDNGNSDLDAIKDIIESIKK